MNAPTKLQYANDGRQAHPALPPPWYPYRHCVVALRSSLQRIIGILKPTSSTRVLDYGCSVLQYRNLFPADCDYRGADLPGNALATVDLSKDGRIILPDGQVDIVLSTQVLEHVQDPALYIAEAYRVLAPGGNLILTTHGIFVYHPDPEDNWRWTSTGLSRQIEAAGFQIREIEGLIGGLPAAIQMIQDMTWRKLPHWLRKPYFAFFQFWIGLFDRAYSTEGRLRNAWVYAVLAQKPAGK